MIGCRLATRAYKIHKIVYIFYDYRIKAFEIER